MSLQHSENPRTVSDILWFEDAPVAFTTARNPENEKGTPGQYVCVCPWCAKDLGVVTAAVYGDLYADLFALTAEHVLEDCPNGNRTPPKLMVQLQGGSN